MAESTFPSTTTNTIAKTPKRPERRWSTSAKPTSRVVSADLAYGMPVTRQVTNKAAFTREPKVTCNPIADTE